MREATALVVAAALLLGAAALALAEGGDNPWGTPAVQNAPAAEAQPVGQPAGQVMPPPPPGWQGAPPPVAPPPEKKRGMRYLKITPESQQLWLQLAQAQWQVATEQWGLFLLLNQQPVDQEKLRAQYEKLKAANQSVQQTQKALEPYWLEMPPPAGLHQPPPGVGGPPPPGAGGPPPPPAEGQPPPPPPE